MCRQEIMNKHGLFGIRFTAILLLVSFCYCFAGCAPFPRKKDCLEISLPIQKAFHFKSIDELVSNVSALPLEERMNAYVYGMQCLHPPHKFLARTLVGNQEAMWEAFQRMDSDLTDSERFSYLELIAEFHTKKYINLNADDDLRSRVRKSLSRYKSANRREFSIHLFNEDGVQF